MLIRVRYPDGLTRIVRPALLHQLIMTQKISDFRRADGWVKLGVDPIRRRRVEDYAGPERREVQEDILHQV
jgi:hypothetical protein